MAFGLFGAFILGFLGTAMPRMLSARPLRPWEVIPLLLLHSLMVFAFLWENISVGDFLFIALLAGFVSSMMTRIQQRKDTPPPGFILVGLAFLCVAAGSLLGLALHFVEEPDGRWITLQKLLAYQGFVLLPILGIGPFILPRLFGLESSHNFPESLIPPRAWRRKAALAASAGFLIIASFVVETFGFVRFANGIRFAVTLGYIWIAMPFHRAPPANSSMGSCIRLALGGVLAGFLTVACWPAYRVGLLHFTLGGGFAIITFVVATRVVFGHSGQLDRLKGPNRWLLAAIGLMLLGMATRISADFLPKVLVSHYIYGALSWIAGLLLWSAFVLPKV